MTPAPLITLTTDFGEDSPYVAAMKGVILSTNPAAHLVDLSHQIPPQDVRHGAFFLAGALPYFPPGTLHVVVVDPGVGTDRAVLHVEWHGQRLLVPDNGVWTLLPGANEAQVRHVTNAALFREAVSATFHGRDIFAPVAGHLGRGVSATELGPVVKEWVRVEVPEPQITTGPVIGEVVFVDRFGNLITNIPASAIRADGQERVSVGGGNARRTIRWVGAYGEAPAGTLVALISSFGTVEVAEVQGNAAARLRAGVGTRVSVCLKGVR
jgi:S-adenosylmethionine hydrolase